MGDDGRQQEPTGGARPRPARLGMAVVLAVALAILPLAPAQAAPPAAARPTVAGATVSVPSSPVGRQLAWLLSLTQLPLSAAEVTAHFDAAFLAQADPSQLNAALESLSATGHQTLLAVRDVEPTSLVAVVEFGTTRYTAQLSVDPTGLIAGLRFTPDATLPKSWSAVDRELVSVAPRVSLLAARVGAGGTCVPVRSVAASTPRPLGSMFKLFVLGALARAVQAHKVSWTQEMTVTAAVKVGGSGTLHDDADGTQLTVEQVATKMISVSDNTAADMLLGLLGRPAVEAQVRRWTAHPSLDTPFLTVAELFALKYHDFPAMADHYLSLAPSARARYLASTVDALSATSERQSGSPRDVSSIEWFASADDLCRAFAGLAALGAEPGLSPLQTILSANDGGIQLSPGTWPTVWFKGGSEPGVLTLGYLARDTAGQTYVVVALTEDPRRALAADATTDLLATVAGAFALLH
jgi:beta-lactamase class A